MERISGVEQQETMLDVPSLRLASHGETRRVRVAKGEWDGQLGSHCDLFRTPSFSRVSGLRTLPLWVETSGSCSIKDTFRHSVHPAYFDV
jgi:hypothetical protein